MKALISFVEPNSTYQDIEECGCLMYNLVRDDYNRCPLSFQFNNYRL
jgi:hypothetical protein